MISHEKEEILNLAADLDNDLEKKDIKKLISYFSDDCEIELLGITLIGHVGLKKWLEWFFKLFKKIIFEPIVIMVENNIFFEEFYLHGTTLDDKKLSVKVSEVLEYEDYKIKSLRLYLDRLLFSDALQVGVLSSKIVKLVKQKSLEGLI